jgi:hypothetical protein
MPLPKVSGSAVPDSLCPQIKHAMLFILQRYNTLVQRICELRGQVLLNGSIWFVSIAPPPPPPPPLRSAQGGGGGVRGMTPGSGLL